jgi:hypothetical protein
MENFVAQSGVLLLIMLSSTMHVDTLKGQGHEIGMS